MALKTSHKLVLLLVALIATLVSIFAREKPRFQLIGQSTSNLSMVLRDYIAKNGKMPDGIGDLEKAGLVRPVDASEHRGSGTYRETGKYQLTTAYSNHILYYFDDIQVNWSVNRKDLVVKEGQLVNRLTGEATYIMRAWNGILLKTDDTTMEISIRLYEALCRAQQEGPEGEQNAE